MLVLFVVLFITFEAVLLKKKDPEPWRHVFSIIYYGFGDANRYTYYAKPENTAGIPVKGTESKWINC